MSFISKENFKSGDAWLGSGGGGAAPILNKFTLTGDRNGTVANKIAGAPTSVAAVVPEGEVAHAIITDQAVPAVVNGSVNGYYLTVGQILTVPGMASIKVGAAVYTKAVIQGINPVAPILGSQTSTIGTTVTVGIYSDAAGTVPIIEHSVTLTA